jgi:hypothetical protein
VLYKHRGNEETENFELYSKEELKAVFIFIILTQGDQGKEGLRARNMSIVSPRTFWSMV